MGRLSKPMKTTKSNKEVSLNEDEIEAFWLDF
jgi:hypothetical protein